jgi:integrase
MSTRAISGIGKKAMRNVGIVSDRLVCHSFRHTACTFALKGGASLLDAQVMMRHVDPRTTMYYVHQIERTGSNAGERCISRYLGSVDA